MRRSFAHVTAAAFAGGASLFAGSAVTADVLSVPDQYPTIQAAINAAVNGDEVVLQPGIYNETFDYLGKGLVVRSAEGPLTTRIDRNGAGGTVVTANGTPEGTRLEGIGIYDAGGLAVEASLAEGLTLETIRIINSSSTPFVLSSSDAVLRDIQIISCGNRAVIDGSSAVALDRVDFRYGRGGLQVSAGQVTLDFCDFERIDDSALYATGGTVTAADCLFNETGATKPARGGLAYLQGSDATFERCVFRNGRVAYQNSNTHVEGGCVFQSGGVSMFVECSFDDGWAYLNGSYSLECRGGCLSIEYGETSFQGCLIQNCRVERNGGTRFAMGGSLYARDSVIEVIDSEIDRSLLWNNYGGQYTEGQGISVDGGSLRLRRSSVRNGRSVSDNWDLPSEAVFAEGAIVEIIDVEMTDNFLVSHGSDTSIPVRLGQVRSFECSNLECSGGGIDFQSLHSEFEGDLVIQGLHVYGGSSRVFDFSSLSSDHPIRVIESRLGGGSALSLPNPPNNLAISFEQVAFIGYSTAVYVNDYELFFNGCSFINCSTALSINADTSYFPLVVDSIFCGPRETQIVGPWIDKGGNVFDADCTADCDGDGLPDDYEIQSGLDADCNGNGLPDSCESGGDCDEDGILDSCAIADGSLDCNGNGLPDECEADCDGDGLIDVCAIEDGAEDCNADGVPDACQLASGEVADANNDGIPDPCQSLDFTGLATEIVMIEDRILDSTVPATAVCYRLYATFDDIQGTLTGVFGDAEHPMLVAAPGGFWQDAFGGDTTATVTCDEMGMFPDLRYDSWLTIGADCASDNMVLEEGIDFTTFNAGGALAADDGIVFITPDDPQGDAGKAGRVLLGQFTSTDGSLPTGTVNLLGQNADGTDWIAYDIGWPEPPLLDCNGNGIHDAYDLSSGTSRDCDGSGLPDECEYGEFIDCNNNGIPDLCDVADGTSGDADGDFVPDECECLGDTNRDGLVNVYDIIEVILHWGETGELDADVSEDGVVDGLDLSLVLQGYGGCL